MSSLVTSSPVETPPRSVSPPDSPVHPTDESSSSPTSSSDSPFPSPSHRSSASFSSSSIARTFRRIYTWYLPASAAHPQTLQQRIFYHFTSAESPYKAYYESAQQLGAFPSDSPEIDNLSFCTSYFLVHGLSILSDLLIHALIHSPNTDFTLTTEQMKELFTEIQLFPPSFLHFLVSSVKEINQEETEEKNQLIAAVNALEESGDVTTVIKRTTGEHRVTLTPTRLASFGYRRAVWKFPKEGDPKRHQYLNNHYGQNHNENTEFDETSESPLNIRAAQLSWLRKTKQEFECKRDRFLAYQMDSFSSFLSDKVLEKLKEARRRFAAEEKEKEEQFQAHGHGYHKEHREKDKGFELACFIDYDELLKGNEATNIEQPARIIGGDMRPYQLRGLRFLQLLHENGASGILADEMGLG
jgi:hypothetical protein